MNKKTDLYNTNLTDRRKYVPMVACPHWHATDTVGDIYLRPATKEEAKEGTAFYKVIEPNKRSK